MYACLGADILKNPKSTTFQFNNTFIHSFIDPCHSLKLVRNTFGDLKVFIDIYGREVNFKYVELLLELQNQKGLHLATKITKAHIHYEKQKIIKCDNCNLCLKLQ